MTNHTPQSNNGRLSADERAEMKSTFMAYVDENPVARPARAASLSPYFPRIRANHIRVPAFAFVALFLIVSGTAYTAEASLPNEFLYPVKTGVLERLFIEGPAFSSHAKARASGTLISRRLEEARELAEKDTLTPETAAYLASEISELSYDAQGHISAAVEAGDLSQAIAISTDIESTLDAYGAVLESIAKENGNTSIAVHTLAEDVDQEAGDADTASDLLEAEVASTTLEAQEFIEHSHEEIDTLLTSLRENVAADAKDTVGFADNAQALIEKAEYSRGVSETSLNGGKLLEAVEETRDALRAARQAAIYQRAFEESSSE